MQQDTRTEARKRLDDEERLKQMQEGGEDMRAQLAMEEAERSKGSVRVSGLTPEEEERRRVMGADGYIPGMGETQQAQMAMWGKEKQGAERPMYPAGTGGHYQPYPDVPAYRASSGESFTGGAPFHEGQPLEQAARPEVDAGLAGAYPSQKPPVTKNMTDQPRESAKSGRAEESANRAGETIGKVIRKAMVLGKEMSSGIRKGLGR